jgi:hypothetical protein
MCCIGSERWVRAYVEGPVDKAINRVICRDKRIAEVELIP